MNNTITFVYRDHKVQTKAWPFHPAPIIRLPQVKRLASWLNEVHEPSSSPNVEALDFIRVCENPLVYVER